MKIEEMTTKEFAEAVARDPIVFLPMGATEAHGIHLPLCTDTVQPEALCAALAEKFDGLQAPTVNYGQHSSTRNMSGTITLRFDTVRSLVGDILDSLSSQGIRKVVIVSGHAGSLHMAAIKAAAEEVVRRTELKLMVLTDYDIAYRFPLSEKDYPDGHGGIIETSRVMAIRPDLVRSKKPKGLFEDKRFMVVPDPESCYPEGMVGDATKASAELGKEINRFIFDNLADLIRKNFGV